MGEAEIIRGSNQIFIRSTFYFYGDSASRELADQIASTIAMHWNEPRTMIKIKNHSYEVRFEIEGIYAPGLAPETVWYNDNPQLNFFRVEEFVFGNISFVDGLGSNTGYFKLDNLLQTSTTAAHEYGHTLGLDHPANLDLRGGVVPGIMYPRGTICDPHLQYDPTAAPAAHGGFLDPAHRKVSSADIENLNLHKLIFNEKGTARVGEFSSLYHEKHLTTPDFK